MRSMEPTPTIFAGHLIRIENFKRMVMIYQFIKYNGRVLTAPNMMEVMSAFLLLVFVTYLTPGIHA